MEKTTNNATQVATTNNNEQDNNALHYNKDNFVISKDARRQDKARNYICKNFFNNIDIQDDANKDGTTLATFTQTLKLTNDDIKKASEFANNICNDITTIYTHDKNGNAVLICDLFTCKKCLASAIFDARHGKNKNIFEKSQSWYAVCKNYIKALHQQKDAHDAKQLAKSIAREQARTNKRKKDAKTTQQQAN